MLVLSRTIEEEIVVNGNIRIKVVEIVGNKVRLGISAPPEVRIDRAEIDEARKKSSEKSETAIASAPAA